jgi:hypothetical protein
MTKTLIENQATVMRLMEQMEQQRIQITSLQVNFINIGNITMITMIVKDSQIQSAVNLQRCINCEKQINFVLKVHVEAYSSIFKSNKMCISISVYTVCVLYTVDIYKRAHIALSLVQHTAQSDFTFHIFLQAQFTLN